MCVLRSVLLSACVAAVACSPPLDDADAGSQPALDDPPTDVVFVVVDTLRADASSWSHTPHLDALASEGVTFSNAFSHAPLTLPAHAALFSSRLATSSRVTNNGQTIGTTLPLLAEHMGRQGYRTLAATSLATMWPIRAGRGLDRGFDDYDRCEREVAPATDVNARLLRRLRAVPDGRALFFFAHYSDPHQPYNAHGTRNVPARIELDGEPLATIDVADMQWWEHTVTVSAGEHELTVDADKSVYVRRVRATAGRDRLEIQFEDGARNEARRSHRVRFTAEGTVDLSVWLHDAPEPEEIRRRYQLEVEAADRAIGELLTTLRNTGRYAESLIVFTSDHGEGLGEHGSVGHARHLYDEVLAVPLIIKLPAGHPRAAELQSAAGRLARHIDVVPTVLELLELPPLDDADGASLLDPSGRVLTAEVHPPEAPTSLFAIRDLEHKLIYDSESERFELYDVVTDPGELDDVFQASSPRFDTWRRRLLLRAETEREAAVPLDPETARRLEALGY
ncbi:MAG: sulfatase-like hydrolase/transferase [bacterium]|nr:sulfatase-like hydrolase/transferase [bacterium]